jgi:hypothetical protein
MDRKFLVFLSLSMIVVGFTGGFFLATALQEQIEVLIGAAIILAFLTWLGTGADFLGLLREWYREKKDAERTPTLEAGKIYKNLEDVYFLTLKKVKGEGLAEGCAAYLTVQGTNINNSATVWEHAATREYSIGTRQGLRLFRVYQNTEIYFPAAGIESNFGENALPYNEAIKKELIIDIQARIGNVPSTTTIKISDIIAEGDKN